MNVLFDKEKNKPEGEFEEKERYILFSISWGDEEKAYRSLDELEDLLETAGGVSVAKMVQNLTQPDRSTYIGKGKVEELKDLMEKLEVDAVLCDDELGPSQHRNLAEVLDAKVVDRTMLILDIFAKRAATREGKIQVEMAQLKYRASRLTGKGTALSRLGGGIGTRGPGESKLESDRRAIQRRVESLSAEIETMERVRSTARKKRVRSITPVVAIVGYTNAGKSTLLNKLANADILAEDKLFATLDPTTRICTLPSGQEIMMTDTVGFINKLPHELIDAFRSTLEEARYADIILHMVDASSPDKILHMEVVYDTLKTLGIKDKPIITAFNKVDKLKEDAGNIEDVMGDKNPLRNEFFEDRNSDLQVEISVKTGEGMDHLFEEIENIIRETRDYIEEVIPYSDSGKVAKIRKHGQLIQEIFLEEGIFVKAYVPKTIK